MKSENSVAKTLYVPDNWSKESGLIWITNLWSISSLACNNQQKFFSVKCLYENPKYLTKIKTKFKPHLKHYATMLHMQLWIH